MKKNSLVVVMALLLCTACSSPLEKEYAKLKAETAATNAGAAEELYNKIEKFVARVEKTKGAPKGLLDKARELQQQRAKEFGIVSAKNLEIKNLGKVWRAWVGAKLDPEKEAAKVGIDVKKIEEDRKFLKSDDPRDWK